MNMSNKLSTAKELLDNFNAEDAKRKVADSHSKKVEARLWVILYRIKFRSEDGFCSLTCTYAEMSDAEIIRTLKEKGFKTEVKRLVYDNTPAEYYDLKIEW